MTVNAGDVVTLNGDNSTDLDNDALTYTWKQISGPSVTLSRIDKPFAIFTAPKDISSDTDMIFELIASDELSKEGRIGREPFLYTESVEETTKKIS